MIERVYYDDLDDTIFMVKQPLPVSDIHTIMSQHVYKMQQAIWDEVRLLGENIEFVLLPEQDPYLTFYSHYNEMMRVTIFNDEESQQMIIVDVAVKGKHLN